MHELKRQEFHFIGIGGSGMSGIARVLLEKGHRVSGSDIVDTEMIEQLKQLGARITIGHDAQNLVDQTTVVYSSDVPVDNVELVAAREKGLRVLHRSEMLAELLADKKAITIAGAHGKTTTASMLAWVFELDYMSPSYVVGSEINDLGVNARAGIGDYFIAEADESDGSFLNYHPYINIITNIESDHLENYEGDFNNLLAAYEQYVKQVDPRGLTVICYDDQYARQLIDKIPGKVITYGFSPEADYYAGKPHKIGKTTSFAVFSKKGGIIGGLKINLPGDHNVLNALAVLIASLHVGIHIDDMQPSLSLFTGVKRRFQHIGTVNGVTVIDDYGHHPTEIAATIASAEQLGGRIIVAFKPLRYSRTYFFLEQFGEAFADADQILVTEIHSPAGDSLRDKVNAKKLVEVIKRASKKREEAAQREREAQREVMEQEEREEQVVRYFATTTEIVEYLAGAVEPGDIVITQGAGDIWTIGERLFRRLDH